MTERTLLKMVFITSRATSRAAKSTFEAEIFWVVEETDHELTLQ